MIEQELRAWSDITHHLALHNVSKGFNCGRGCDAEESHIDFEASRTARNSYGLVGEKTAGWGGGPSLNRQLTKVMAGGLRPH